MFYEPHKIDRHILFLLLVVSLHAFAADTTISDRLTATGYVSLARDLHQPPQLATLDGVSCEVLDRPADGRTLVLPVDAHGRVTIPAGTLPSHKSGSLGWRIAAQYLSSAPEAKKRMGYFFLDAAGATAPFKFAPPGLRTDQARINTREVLPATTRRVFPTGTLPTSVRLSLSFGLLNDWKLDGKSGVTFSVSLLGADGKAEKLYENDLDGMSQEIGPPWMSVDLDLGAFAGKSVSLQLDTKDIEGAPSPNLAYPLWGDVALYTTAPPAQRVGPSVLLISLDTLRADRLGCYGYPRGTSPNIDAFANEACLFANAFSPAPMTTPAHASIFTGVSPYVHRAGIFTEGFHLAPQWTPLAELLGAKGYRTHAQTEGIAVAGMWGFARGFQTYSDGPSPKSHERMIVEETFQASAKWLKQFGHLPFLLFTHTYQLHDPYESPKAFLDRFVDPAYKGAQMASPGRATTPEERRDASDRYDAGIAYTDAALGDFFQQLRALGLFDNTWIVLVSDHGEEFWEHGGYAHARTLYNESVHVPLIIRPPGGIAGKRVATPVLTTDLFATLLEIANVDLPEGRESKSLLPFVKAETDNDAPIYARTVVDGFFRGYEDAEKPGGPAKEWEVSSLRDGEHTYIATTPQPPFGAGATVKEEVYSASSDRAEQHDVSSTENAVLEHARNSLKALRATEDALKPKSSTPTKGMEQEDIDALKGLGYF